MIRLDGLTKAFGNFCAVNNVSLAVNKGEIFGFVGLNGAGKSATIHLNLWIAACFFKKPHAFPQFAAAETHLLATATVLLFPPEEVTYNWAYIQPICF